MSFFFSFIIVLVKAFIDSSPLSIISIIKSAITFAKGCENPLLHTIYFLTPSENRIINDNRGLLLVLFLFFLLPLAYLISRWCFHQKYFDTLPCALIRDGCRSTSVPMGVDRHRYRWASVYVTFISQTFWRIIKYPNVRT